MEGEQRSAEPPSISRSHSRAAAVGAGSGAAALVMGHGMGAPAIHATGRPTSDGQRALGSSGIEHGQQ